MSTWYVERRPVTRCRTTATRSSSTHPAPSTSNFVSSTPSQPTGAHTGSGDDASIATAAVPLEAPRRGRLIVRSSDSLAALEVTDAAGQTLRTAMGTVELRDVPAGVYRVRLRTPENQIVEQLVELGPGAEREIALPAPDAPMTSAVTSFVETAGGRVHADNTVELHEGGAQIVAPRLSTVLGVAGAAAIEDGTSGRALGFRAQRGALGSRAECGLAVILGVDWTDTARAREYLSRVGIRMWRLGEPVPAAIEYARPVATMAFAAEYARAVEPGSYWLALEPTDSAARMILTVAVLPGRTTLFTVQLGAPQPCIFAYAPSSGRLRSSEPDAVRRLEVMERLLVGGQLGAAFDAARDVLESPRIVDPLGTCLAAYIALRVGRVAIADRAIEQLEDEYWHLSDVHVLRGESVAAAGRPGSADAFSRAVAAGAPVFAEGLTRLLEGTRSYGIEHPRTQLVRHVFDRHLTGSMWSAWRPDNVRAGHLLIP